ncbi:hypothetical protein TNCV_4891111 [Trichonephila clavipes]|nr:hypothetical protein TNCV_4891111 [Trichonephila clavipes]
MKEDGCCKKIFLAKPIENKPRGRSLLRWMDCILEDLNNLKKSLTPRHKNKTEFDAHFSFSRSCRISVPLRRGENLEHSKKKSRLSILGVLHRQFLTSRKHSRLQLLMK